MLLIVQRERVTDKAIRQQAVSKRLFTAGPVQGSADFGTQRKFGGIWMFTDAGDTVELQFDAEGLLDLSQAVSECLALFAGRAR